MEQNDRTAMKMNLQALPQESDYTAATDLVNDELGRHGGAWVAAYAEEKQAAWGTERYTKMLQAGMVAGDLEPLDADDRPLDPLRHTTHAFKHGMAIGHRVIHLVHDNLIDHAGTNEYFSTVLSAGDTTQYQRAEKLVDMGERGLARAGDAARDRIDVWSDDAVSDVRARRMYGLGCGAVIYAAYAIHSGHNDVQLQKYFAQYRW